MDDTENRRTHDRKLPTATPMRMRAEVMARERSARSPEDLETLPLEDTRRMLHELQVHQIELELQNEELCRAQTELDAVRARYFDLYDLAPVGYCTLSEQGLILEANLTAATLLGVARGELTKQPLSRFILTEDQDLYYRRCKILFETGEPQACDLRMLRTDGTFFWAHLETTVAQNSDGASVCRTVLSNITARKEAEATLAARTREFEAVRAVTTEITQELDLPVLLARITRHAAELVGAASSIIRIWDAHAQVLVPVTWHGLGDWIGAEVRRLDEAVSGTVAARREGMIVNDYPVSSYATSTILEQAPITAVLAEPLLHRERLLGVLAVDRHAGASPFTEQDRQILSLFATQAAITIENARLYTEAQQELAARTRAEQALRDSESFIRAVMDHLPMGIAVSSLDSAGEFTYMNDNFPKYYRTTRAALANPETFWDAVYEDPDFREAVKKRMRDDCASGYPGRMQWVDVPITRQGDQTTFVSAMNTLLPGKRVMISTVWDVTERKRAEEALWQFKIIFDTANFGAVITDLDGVMAYANAYFAAAHGYDATELCGQPLSRVHTEDQRGLVDRLMRQLVREGAFSAQEVGHCRRDGTVFPMLMTGIMVRDTNGVPQCLAITALDITEHKALEGQLQQARKMESVGRLAGGVAHDFNNMLTVILGHVEMALLQVEPTQPLHADLVEIHTAAGRSAALTRQLLAFARKQTIMPTVLDLNDAVAGMLTMLRRLIGENVHFRWQPGDHLWPVRIDPSQVDQILANLCVNARDAITGTGMVTIETGNVVFDDAACVGRAGCVPGEYVRLSVSDTGSGMDQATLSQIFEPFFTTKGVGKGTGLGLATVYGAMTQNKGFIDVQSEPGQGTTFVLYLPRDTGEVRQAAAGDAAHPAPRGCETVLLVEDEPTILALTTRLLAQQGYTVLAARSPDEAIRLARERASEIRLLMTDVVLPEMNGCELATQVAACCPQVKTLFMSGYADNILTQHGALEEGALFIQKPFSVRDVTTKVREALGGKIMTEGGA